MTRAPVLLDAGRTLALLPPLAQEAFAASPPVTVPPEPTAAMPREAWEAGALIEAERMAPTAGRLRALARKFRKREVPAYRVLARAAMVEALLHGPCTGGDAALAARLLDFRSTRPAWVALRAWLEVLVCLREESEARRVLAALGEAVRVHRRLRDPLGLLHAMQAAHDALRREVNALHAEARERDDGDAAGRSAPRKAGDAPAGPDAPRFLTVPEVAKRLGLGERTVRRFTAEGLIPVQRLGRAVRIDPRELDRLPADLRNRGRKRKR